MEVLYVAHFVHSIDLHVTVEVEGPRALQNKTEDELADKLAAALEGERFEIYVGSPDDYKARLVRTSA